MSRKFGAFNPASTATTLIVVSSPDYNSARFLVANAPSTSSSVKYYHSFESTLTTIQFGGGTVSSNAGAAIATTAASVKIGTQSLDFPGNDPVTIVPASAGDFSLTSAYTLELFFRREATGGVWSTMLGSTNANSVGWPFLSTRYDKFRAKDYLVGSTTISNNVWYHGALVRYSDGSAALFLNGEKDATTSSLAEFVTDNFVLGAINVADSGDGNWNGQLDEIRFTREALYSTTFTVPTKALFVPGTDDLSDQTTLTTSSDVRAHSHVWNYSDIYKARRADTWPSNTFDTRISLYLPFDEDFRDLSSYGHTASSAGGASIQSSIKQHGAGSLLLNGTDQYVTIPNHASFQFGSGDFTIEAWVYQTATAGSDAADRHPIVSRMDGSTNRSFHVGIVESSGQQKLQFSYTTDGESGTAGQYTFDCDVTINAWHNVAIVREGSNLYGFLNGTSLSSSTAGQGGAISSKTIFVGTSPLTIGYRGLSDQYFQGYIDDVRVTKGLAVYTTSYSVRTDPVGGSLTINP